MSLSRTSIPRDRVRNLEAQVGEIYDILRSSQNHAGGSGSSLTPESLLEQRHATESIVERPITRQTIPDQPSTPWPHDPHETLPSSESLNKAVEVYGTRLYFQPLPLFRPEGLRDRVESFPLFLQWIFLALSLSNLPYDSNSAKEADLIHLRARSARDTVLELAMRGTAKLEISQALCLLALADILEGRPALALMAIGAASRLELVRSMSFLNSPQTNPQDDASLRCYWSVFILEKAFAPRFTLLSQSLATPEYPRSTREPSPPSCQADEDYAPDLANIRDDSTLDSGIIAHALRGVSFWGDVISYIHSIRLGQADSPSNTDSSFYKLTNKLYDLEAQLGHVHFVRNVGFSERTLDELKRHHEYWVPWLVFQMSAHATQGVLNHPFIHLVTLRKANRPSQPRLFLQGTVDQAMFHSSWVARLAQTCMDIGFVVYDPLICDMVAATATIAWLFQYARDSAQKLELLHQLQTMSSQAQDNNMISFQPAKIWQLIDSDIMDTVAPQVLTDDTPGGQSNASNTTVSVQTTFVHPVGDKRAQRELHPDAQLPSADGFYEEGLEQFSLDSIFSQPIFIDHAWLHV
ncbi:hypothetical protein CEP52_002020 [Fusarium oligoseptatum]|uniref:Xylanolytic transcriptional activator regulatory domain-containing protein n=1 Tax=Fusarium oligoseptatum TaxID=2604345 RepID=A0A428UFM1_9HYPO|nr:hypothetical protein CEP52_002020 [Fusarium oligoseptatum]